MGSKSLPGEGSIWGNLVADSKYRKYHAYGQYAQRDDCLVVEGDDAAGGRAVGEQSTNWLTSGQHRNGGGVCCLRAVQWVSSRQTGSTGGST